MCGGGGAKVPAPPPPRKFPTTIVIFVKNTLSAFTCGQVKNFPRGASPHPPPPKMKYPV